MKSISCLCVTVLLLASACSESDDGGNVGGMFVEEPVSPCRQAYDTVYDACLEELSSTCIGLACLFIFGECQTRALREASRCCASSAATQDGFDACMEPMPGVDPP